MVLCDYLIDDDDFDPEAGFQKEDPQNQWEGEDEGLDIDVSGWDPYVYTISIDSRGGDWKRDHVSLCLQRKASGTVRVATYRHLEV